MTPPTSSYGSLHNSDERLPALRIGELSRRVGVDAGTIRAWERRYGLPEPRRTEGGYRLYTAEDEAMIRELTRLRETGDRDSRGGKTCPRVPPSRG